MATAGCNVAFDKMMFGKIIGLMPRIEQLVRIIRLQTALIISDDQPGLFKPTNDTAGITLVKTGTPRQFPLSEAPVWLDEKPARNARAFRGEYVWGPAGFFKTIRSALDMDEEAGPFDVGISGEIHPCNAMFVAKPATRLAHEGNDQKGDAIVPQIAFDPFKAVSRQI